MHQLLFPLFHIQWLILITVLRFKNIVPARTRGQESVSQYNGWHHGRNTTKERSYHKAGSQRWGSQKHPNPSNGSDHNDLQHFKRFHLPMVPHLLPALAHWLHTFPKMALGVGRGTCKPHWNHSSATLASSLAEIHHSIRATKWIMGGCCGTVG